MTPGPFPPSSSLPEVSESDRRLDIRRSASCRCRARPSHGHAQLAQFPTVYVVSRSGTRRAARSGARTAEPAGRLELQPVVVPREVVRFGVRSRTGEREGLV